MDTRIYRISKYITAGINDIFQYNNMKTFLESLGIKIKNEQLYRDALTHKSYGNENNTSNNERLEFLGDAVLELVVTQSLFVKYPDLPEGDMTALRSALVRKESLASLAKKLDIGPHIRLSTGEKKGKGAQKDYILANTIEAILGAIYLDQGLKACEKFLSTYLLPGVVKVKEEQTHIRPKTRFQEFAQGELLQTPTYRLLSEAGPDHHKNFVMGAYLGDELVGKGEGNSKQKAETKAAENAYEGFIKEK